MMTGHRMSKINAPLEATAFFLEKVWSHGHKKKQYVLAGSSTEFEYRSFAHGAT